MAKVMTDSVHYESIADSLRQTTGSADKYMPSQMAAGIMGAFDAGKQSQWNMLWDAIMNGGHLTQEKMGLFCGNHWNDANFYPKYDIVPITGTYLFKDCRITDLKGRLEEMGRKLDVSLVTNFYAAFQGSTITRLPALDMSGATNLTQVFFSCGELAHIEKLIVNKDATFSSTFTYCRSLEDVTIEGTIGSNVDFQYCTKLTHESLMSIIDALEEKTSGSWVLTLGSANLAKLTDAEKAIATQKGWTLV